MVKLVGYIGLDDIIQQSKHLSFHIMLFFSNLTNEECDKFIKLFRVTFNVIYYKIVQEKLKITVGETETNDIGFRKEMKTRQANRVTYTVQM